MSKENQVDNSALEEKLLLRLNSIAAIEKDEIKVLECFGGEGVLWKAVAMRTTKKISSIRIDIKYGLKGFYLRGNNLNFLASMDLSNFDVIDLDAYGSPYPQLKLVFKREFKGVVHCTFIQSGMGNMHEELLETVGFNKRMIKKCHTLFVHDGFKIMKNYLAQKGVKRLHVITLTRLTGGGNSNKYYFWFNL